MNYPKWLNPIAKLVNKFGNEAYVLEVDAERVLCFFDEDAEVSSLHETQWKDWKLDREFSDVHEQPVLFNLFLIYGIGGQIEISHAKPKD